MLETIKKILAKQLRKDESLITPEAAILEDLGADSLDIVEMLIRIEDELGVRIPDDDVADLKTVGDVAAYCEAHKA